MPAIATDEHTISEHHIQTLDGMHTLYVQEWGNPQGTPLVYLHGGPGGGGTENRVKQLFDPIKHYVIMFDQRGAGQSTPYGSCEANTTALLVSDIEQIRTQFNISKWTVLGRSWGSTLALCYAIQHPERVAHIITGAVSLGTTAEDEWLISYGLPTFYPEVWQQYGSDTDSILKFARLVLPTLKLDDRYDKIDTVTFDEQFLQIEHFYHQNKWFIDDNYILNNVAKLTMPVTIIQGRYDMLTPPVSAYKLHQVLPNSTLQWTIAGHSKSDRGNFDATKAVLNTL